MATNAHDLDGRERRIDARHEISADATIRGYRAQPLPAALLDVSTGGAMLRGDTHDLAKGDEIVLDTGEVEIVATIAWSNESFFGLAFHRRLEPREMSWLKRVGRA